MKVEVDLTEYGVKAPKWYDPINPHVINVSGGSGGSNDVELTWEEYEALSEEEKMNGSNYFITDIGNPKSLTTKVLLSESNLTTTTYNLNDSIENYDYLYVNLAWQNKGSRLFSILKVSDIFYTSNGSIYGIVGTVDVDFAYLNYRFNSSTQIAIWQKSSSIPTNFVLTITGYRYERVVVPNQMVNYSTVEQRIGTWIDGKPLYQKTFVKTNLNIGSGITGFEIDLSDVSDVFYISGTIKESTHYFILPWAGQRSTGIEYHVEDHKIYMRSTDTFSNANVYFTVRYTKTTD